jgi:chorismate--pyruvate lyase
MRKEGANTETTASQRIRPDAEWINEAALHLRERDAVLRSWLTTPGLLTERVRASVGPRFCLRVLEERRSCDDFVRRIELGRDDEPWIYAETTVPALTLAKHPWLSAIGSRSLGEVLAAHAASVRRSEFEFARLHDGEPLVARALALAALSPRPLWARRSTMSLQSAPFVICEVFLPIVCGARE